MLVPSRSIEGTDVLEIEVDALSIPDEITVNIEGKEIGDQIFASDITLPAGAELTSDPETLVVNVTFFQEDEELEAAAAEAEEGGAGVYNINLKSTPLVFHYIEMTLPC